MLKKVKAVLLIIRDGWGEAPTDTDDRYNALRQAKAPCALALKQQWPHTTLKTCGRDVGLPEGIMGNSEVGHQNIGAGRIVLQERVRLDAALGKLQVENTAALEALKKYATHGRVHLMGLLSDGGVHSALAHLYALVAILKNAGLTSIFIHGFTDGRDTPPQSALGYVQALETQLTQLGAGTLASLCGRFYAMDRDERWDRVQKAYTMLTGDATSSQSPQEALKAYYLSAKDPVSDEFLPPLRFAEGDSRIQDGDAVVFFNFRGDRPRQLIQAFVDPNFSAFPRPRAPKVFFATLTDYQEGLCPQVLFPKKPKMQDTLGEVVSKAGLLQFRCAETEKYPHVTFFFNDYREDPFPGEERCLIPSPRNVPTYDLAPEMSAAAVTQATKAAILSGRYALIVVNYANADMVGHTGSLPATIAACEAVDAGVRELLDAIDATNGQALITADHGNAEMLWDPDSHSPHTRHTCNPVDIILYGPGLQGTRLSPDGRLADIAPTVLALMGLPKPEAMTGQNLIKGQGEQAPLGSPFR